MAITQDTELAEINLRFRGGALVSREAWNRIILKNDDAVIQETGVRADLTEQQLVDAVGSTTSGLTAQIEALKSEKAELAAQVATLQAQIAAGPAPAPPHEDGYPVLTAVQVRLGLLGAGITIQQVDAVIAAIPDVTAREQASTYWEYSITMRRNHPLVGQLAAALGLSSEQVDAMWQAAAALS